MPENRPITGPQIPIGPRDLVADAIISDFTKFAEFTLTVEGAKEYIYSLSTKRRVYNWHDIEVRLYT